jgi:hypothetical protein
MVAAPEFHGLQVPLNNYANWEAISSPWSLGQRIAPGPPQPLNVQPVYLDSRWMKLWWTSV